MLDLKSAMLEIDKILESNFLSRIPAPPKAETENIARPNFSGSISW